MAITRLVSDFLARLYGSPKHEVLRNPKKNSEKSRPENKKVEENRIHRNKKMNAQKSVKVSSEVEKRIAKEIKLNQESRINQIKKVKVFDTKMSFAFNADQFAKVFSSPSLNLRLAFQLFNKKHTYSKDQYQKNILKDVLDHPLSINSNVTTANLACYRRSGASYEDLIDFIKDDYRQSFSQFQFQFLTNQIFERITPISTSFMYSLVNQFYHDEQVVIRRAIDITSKLRQTVTPEKIVYLSLLKYREDLSTQHSLLIELVLEALHPPFRGSFGKKSATRSENFVKLSEIEEMKVSMKEKVREDLINKRKQRHQKVDRASHILDRFFSDASIEQREKLHASRQAIAEQAKPKREAIDQLLYDDKKIDHYYQEVKIIYDEVMSPEQSLKQPKQEKQYIEKNLTSRQKKRENINKEFGATPSEENEPSEKKASILDDPSTKTNPKSLANKKESAKKDLKQDQLTSAKDVENGEANKENKIAGFIRFKENDPPIEKAPSVEKDKKATFPSFSSLPDWLKNKKAIPIGLALLGIGLLGLILAKALDPPAGVEPKPTTTTTTIETSEEDFELPQGIFNTEGNLIIQENDSIWNLFLSLKEKGDIPSSAKWDHFLKKVKDKNSLKDPNLIFPGEKLNVPNAK